jgi:hypothetical protein
MDHLCSLLLQGELPIAENLRLLSSGVRRGISSSSSNRVGRVPREMVQIRDDIIKSSWDLPPSILSVAHSPINTRRRYKAVMDIAENQSWFA